MPWAHVAARLRSLAHSIGGGASSSVDIVEVHRILDSGALTPWVEGSGVEGAFVPPGATGTGPAHGVAWLGDGDRGDPNNPTQPAFDPVAETMAYVHQSLDGPGDVVSFDITNLIRSDDDISGQVLLMADGLPAGSALSPQVPLLPWSGIPASLRTTSMSGGRAKSKPAPLLGPVTLLPINTPVQTPKGGLAAQVLMWDPAGSPTDPETFSGGVLVFFGRGGAVVQMPFGQEQGLTIAALPMDDGQGAVVVEFPFTEVDFQEAR